MFFLNCVPVSYTHLQNEMLNHKDENGKPYSPVYLKTVHNQLSAIFNHAVRYYNLRENPCKKAGSMGKKKNREMMFWTKEQYLKFADKKEVWKTVKDYPNYKISNRGELKYLRAGKWYKKQDFFQYPCFKLAQRFKCHSCLSFQEQPLYYKAFR